MHIVDAIGWQKLFDDDRNASIFLLDITMVPMKKMVTRELVEISCWNILKYMICIWFSFFLEEQESSSFITIYLGVIKALNNDTNCQSQATISIFSASNLEARPNQNQKKKNYLY